MSSGTVIVGITVSVTTTVNVIDVVPKEFDAEQGTEVDPMEKNEPDERVQLEPPSSKVPVPPSEVSPSPPTISGMVSCGGSPAGLRSTTLNVTGPMVRVPVASVARMVTEYCPVVMATAMGISTSIAVDVGLLGTWSKEI